MSEYGILYGEDYSSLTPQEKHSALMARVRRDYQKDNPGSKIFPNQSGVAWQGEMEKRRNEFILKHIRPISFGIPEPEKKKNAEKKSGGADLLGETLFSFATGKIINLATQPPVPEFKEFPVFTGIECKTGNSQLKKNQKVFRSWMKSINAIYFVARECSSCHGDGLSDHGRRMLQAGKMVKPERCHYCSGNGYTLEDK